MVPLAARNLATEQLTQLAVWLSEKWSQICGNLVSRGAKDRSQARMKLTAAYKLAGEWWAASIQEIPGVHTQGKTIEEARENLSDALAMVLEANRELAEKENEASMREAFVVG